MKIRKLKYENHEFFGNLDIDFTNNGKTVDTIVLAGENGCGKSTLVNNLIYPHESNPDKRNGKIIFEIEISHAELDSYERASVTKVARFPDGNILKLALEILKKISPVAWRHIHFQGHFKFSEVNAIDLESIIDKLILRHTKKK